MRNISPLVKSIISQGFYSTFALITLNLKGTTFNFTTLPYDVTIGSTTYSSDNALLTIESPTLGNSLTKDTYTIKLADPNFLYKEYGAHASSSAMSVLIGFLNITGSELLSTSNIVIPENCPIVDVLDLLPAYQGKIDCLQYIMSDTDGIVLEIKATSPMGALDSSNVFYTTSHMLQRRIPVGSTYDTAFDNVTLDTNLTAVLWGKKE